jgi:hypothetical protein
VTRIALHHNAFFINAVVFLVFLIFVLMMAQAVKKKIVVCGGNGFLGWSRHASQAVYMY